MREKILAAYLNDDITIQTATVERPSVEDEFKKLQTPSEELPKTVPTVEGKARKELENIISSTLDGVKGSMRPMKRIVDSVFYVLDKPSIPSLDGVGMFIHRAFTNLHKPFSM